MKKIFIVDYGLGNIHSAQQSIKKVIEEENQKAEVCVTDSAKDLHFATHIILPGQGAFASCMNGLKNIPGMIEELSENVLIQEKPFLGICVGMQLLANVGHENGNHAGLGWINGEIKKIPQYNIKLGSYYLAGLLEEYEGSYPFALAAYNAGPKRVKYWKKINGDPQKGKIS